LIIDKPNPQYPNPNTQILMPYNFIVIEGNIGAGKTSLSHKIAKQFDAKLILEQFADNPFLPKFYKDQEKYAFPLELSFLAARYHQLKKDLLHLEHADYLDFTVSDYFFMKSLIFSKNTLPADEFTLYTNIFNIIYQSLPRPDLYVYLNQNVDNLLVNIRKRGRNYEQHIERAYLEKIERGYFDFFEQFSAEYRFLILNTHKIDFVHNDAHYEQIVKAIMQPYEKGITQIDL